MCVQDLTHAISFRTRPPTGYAGDKKLKKSIKPLNQTSVHDGSALPGPGILEWADTPHGARDKSAPCLGTALCFKSGPGRPDAAVLPASLHHLPSSTSGSSRQSTGQTCWISNSVSAAPTKSQWRICRLWLRIAKNTNLTKFPSTHVPQSIP